MTAVMDRSVAATAAAARGDRPLQLWRRALQLPAPDAAAAAAAAAAAGAAFAACSRRGPDHGRGRGGRVRGGCSI